MPQDGLQIKARILDYVKTNGPSLPVHLARQTGLSILFASAFLSELIADREIKTSNMRVGSSPLYLVPGQEPMLENYSQHLKNKEKEAYQMLRERKFLRDKELEPAIRVALREIKDFAIAFQKGDEIYWRYLTVPETDLSIGKTEQLKEKEAIKEKVPEELILEEEKIEIIEETTPLQEEVITKEVVKHPDKQEKQHKKAPPKKPKKSSKEKEKRNNFFNKVKEILTQKGIEILDIAEISINKIIFRVRKEEEYLIIAYNKKKISEQDIINSSRKAQELGLPYKIMSFNEPPKRFGNLIEAVKNLRDIEKIE